MSANYGTISPFNRTSCGPAQFAEYMIWLFLMEHIKKSRLFEIVF